MFRSITFNGTENKPIGAQILRRTNEMISEFDLQYEKYYKIVKVVSQRELEFQAYLKQQEALQYHLENLIKILKLYFKENNYNQNTYYNIYKPRKISPINKRRKKRKKRGRPKSAVIRRNKYLFYKVMKHNTYYKLYKPYLYPLTNKDKKEHERKIYTDAELKEKEEAKLYNMTPTQLKKFVDVFGFMPSILKKGGEDKEKESNKIKKNKNRRNFSSYNILDSKNRKNFGNKNQFYKKKDVSADGKYMKLIYRGRNKYNVIGNGNITNLKSLSFNNIMNNIINGSNIKTKKSNDYNIHNSKYMQLLTKNINQNIFKKSIIDKLINKNSPTISISNNSHSKINFNNRYLHLNNYNNIRVNSSKNINNNIQSLSHIYTPHLKQSSINNRNDTSNNHNIFTGDNINNSNNTIQIKKNKKIENIKKHRFTDDCIRTIQKSELLTKDIQYINKLHDISPDNFNNRKSQIERKNFGKVDYISFMQIYRKDFKPDIMKQTEKKYEHIKEDMKGHIQLNKIDFIRKDRSKLDFVKIYNKRRDHKRLNKEDFIYHNNDEVKNDLTSYKVPKHFGSIRISRNKINRFKKLSSSSVNIRNK